MAEGDFPKSDGDILFASEVNKIKANLISFPVLNKIRQQQDRSVDTSNNNDDIFSDAYIDSTGREDTVNTGNTTALYNSNAATYSNDNSTAAGSTENSGDPGASGAHDSTSGSFTISGTANANILITEAEFENDNSATTTATIKVQRGGTGDFVTIASNSATGSGTVPIAFTTANYNGVFIESGDNFQVVMTASPAEMKVKNGVSMAYTGTKFDLDATSNSLYAVSSGGITVDGLTTTTSTTKVIEHTIPSGTFPSNVSALIGKSMIDSTETGASITHRLENATENSGDIADGVMGGFTAFTSEPTKYIVKLTSKSTGTPTAGLPRIKGSGVFASTE